MRFAERTIQIMLFSGIGLLIASCISSSTIPTAPAIMPKPTSPEAVSNDIQNTIVWSDNNQPKQSFSLFYDTDDHNFDGTLIVANIPADDPANQFIWHTATVPNGDYYIYATVDDGNQTQNFYITGPITIRHNTACFLPDTRPNLIENSSFETGLLSPKGWNIKIPRVGKRAWNFAWEKTPITAHSGKRAIRINDVLNGINSDSAWKDRVIIESDMLTLPVSGEKLLLTAWVRTDNVAANHILFRLKYYDAKGKQLSLTGHGTDTFFGGNGVSDKWQQMAFLINPPHWNLPTHLQSAPAAKMTVSISLDNTSGTLWVDDISLITLTDLEFDQLDPANRFAAPPITLAETPLSLPASPEGAISTAQDASGAWWLVDADGKAFWGTGVNIASNKKILAALNLSTDEFQKFAQISAHQQLNFNTNWRIKTESNFSPPENTMVWLNFSTETDISVPPEKWVMKNRNGNLMGDEAHYFPDVFSPIWQNNARLEADKLLDDGGYLITNSRVLGYWTDNEFAYGDLYDFLWGDTAKLAFVDWLQGKNNLPSVDRLFSTANSDINLDIPAGFEHPAPYRTIESLNRAWSSKAHTYHYRTFEDIYGKDKPLLRSHNDPIKTDLFAFERVIYKIYVDTIVDNIRQREDTFIAQTGQGMHHLIFSNRFDPTRPAALDDLRRNMDIFNRFDVIALNWYPDFNQSRTFQPRDWMAIIKATFFDTTQRPLYISEFGVAAEDADDLNTRPPLFVSRWRPKTVAHQYQRGWAYANLVATWANLPYVIGANWYQWTNGFGTHGTDPRNSGIVDDVGNFYTPLTDVMRSVNAQVNHIARTGDFSLNDINWNTTTINICEN